MSIYNSFNNASSSYEDVAKVQKQSAVYLTEYIMQVENFYPKRILDLGCGTGYVVEELIKHYYQSQYYLNDISENMLLQCRKKFSQYKNITYLKCDMNALKLRNIDLIISNFSLQWSQNLHATIDCFYSKALKMFAFTTLLNGTFNEWQQILSKYEKHDIQLHHYENEQDLVKFCLLTAKDTQFHHWSIKRHLSFDNPLQFMQYLRLLGAFFSHTKIKYNTIKSLISCKNNPIIVTYEIFFGIFLK